MSAIGKRATPWSAVVSAVALATVFASGCHAIGHRPAFVPAPVPNELDKVSLPEYRVEPPDILLIEAVRTIPKPPYKIEPLDVLYVVVETGDPKNSFAGPLTVDPDGTINLTDYGGPLKVGGMTLPEANAALKKRLASPQVTLDKATSSITLAQGRAAQRISGPHLVRLDGTIALGTYGNVRVSGMTLPEVRRAIETQLSAYLLDPEVSVDVQGYNSKIYYVILDGGGAGQTVVRLPITGNETVLDAISQLRGLSPVSCQDRIWISRPAPPGCDDQILPVDWRAVSERGSTATNYQILPGDRVFVAAYPLTALDIKMARVLAPVERMFGIVLLGSSTVTSVRQINPRNGGVNGSGGFFP